VSTEMDLAAERAKFALLPNRGAAETIKAWDGESSGVDLVRLMVQLLAESKRVGRGDLSRAESMLMVQAHTLDALFNTLARRSALNAGQYLGACETYMRLALKAQSQCRATLETLAEIKNPKPLAFVQQANITNGPQQINNNSAPRTEALRARDFENEPNELLEPQGNERLDGGQAQASNNGDSRVEALGAVHGTSDNLG
jgi:hypothetical protein